MSEKVFSAIYIGGHPNFQKKENVRIYLASDEIKIAPLAIKIKYSDIKEVGITEIGFEKFLKIKCSINSSIYELYFSDVSNIDELNNELKKLREKPLIEEIEKPKIEIEKLKKENETLKSAIIAISAILMAILLGLSIFIFQLSIQKGEIITIEKTSISTVEVIPSDIQYKLAELQSKYDELQARYENLEEQYNEVKSKYDKVLQMKDILGEVKYYRVIYMFTKPEIFGIKIPFPVPTNDIHLEISAREYIEYRLKSHTPGVLSEREDTEIPQYITLNDPTIRYIANWIKNTYDSDMDRINAVLMITHQLKYIQTYYRKYPLETLVEFSGDCDCMTVLGLSIIKAMGYDCVAIPCIVKSSPDDKGGAHMMGAVYLTNMPKDKQYIEVDGKKYYWCEFTGDLSKGWTECLFGRTVGDMVWYEISFRVIKI
ncbi:MAG: hypothetical protein QXY18_01810 [Nitrososphaerota archaeon]